jgi:hypothetical protein
VVPALGDRAGRADYLTSAGGYLGAALVLALAPLTLLSSTERRWGGWVWSWWAGAAAVLLAVLGLSNLTTGLRMDEPTGPFGGLDDGLGGVVLWPWCWLLLWAAAAASTTGCAPAERSLYGMPAMSQRTLPAAPPGGESSTGDPARRSGNEFVFSQLAMQNVEVLEEPGATKIAAACAHCFNTLKNEYPQLGGRYEVVHHTQLLNRLVREGRLTPVAPVAAASTTPVTYHDPC